MMDKRCTECGAVFEGREIAQNKLSGVWGHRCACNPHEPKMRCESYLADIPAVTEKVTSLRKRA